MADHHSTAVCSSAGVSLHGLASTGCCMTKSIDFWFAIGSTYTYLSVSRIGQIDALKDATVRWRPFDLRTMNQEINYRPFADKPVKLAYMWRDVERRCSMYGIPFNGKPPYSIADLPRANRVALVGAHQGWCESYVRTTYRRWFLDHEDPSLDMNIERSLATVGQDPKAVLALAESQEMHDALAEETLEAKRLGVFGSPTFAIGGEIFWGDDRLEDAIRWIK